MNRGDRLVFSNGIIILAVLSGLLIYVFDAHLTKLIQLYLVGVFISFTLSQTMVVLNVYKRRGGRGARRSLRWDRDRDRPGGHHLFQIRQERGSSLRPSPS